ncbi:MAG TPA: hypothetical protein VFB00_01750 [Terriglobales bacterium]|nr:hypothetical protein [Terriglobales bacterium]
MMVQWCRPGIRLSPADDVFLATAWMAAPCCWSPVNVTAAEAVSRLGL